MINKLRFIFRLRKQSDTIKIVFIFGIIGILSIIQTGYYTWEIYHYMNSPAEYVLTGDGNITQENVDELLQEETIAMVSRQLDLPITVMYNGTKTVLDATILSKDFIAENLNLKEDLAAETKKIYVDEETFSQFLLEEKDNQDDILDITSLDIHCQMGDESPDADSDEGGEKGADRPEQKYSAAKLISTKSVGAAHGAEESFIYIADVNQRLLKNASSLRVQFKKHDLDGLQVKHLRTLGYSIVNEERIQEEEYELEVKLLHIRYGLLCFALSLLASCTLVKHYQGASH